MLMKNIMNYIPRRGLSFTYYMPKENFLALPDVVRWCEWHYVRYSRPCHLAIIVFDFSRLYELRHFAN